MRVLTAAAGIAGLMLLAMPAAAQSACLSSEKAAKTLKEKYGESLYAVAVRGNGFLLEIWTNPETGTFSIVSPSGSGARRCFLDSGENFTPVERGAPVPGGDPS